MVKNPNWLEADQLAIYVLVTPREVTEEVFDSIKTENSFTRVATRPSMLTLPGNYQASLSGTSVLATEK